MSTTTTRTNVITTTTFSNALLSKLAVKPSVFKRMLVSNRSSSEIAEVAQVSTRTVQRLRRAFSTVR